MNKLETVEFFLLRDFIEKNCGIHLDENKMYLIESRLTTLMAENGCITYSEFYNKAKNDLTGNLKEKIIDAMTTNETLWFRDKMPFTTIQKLLFPMYGKDLTSGKKNKIRIWSSACSTGQEPYSIAMMILEYCKTQSILRPENFEIIATDISPTVLYIAKTGRYDSHVITRGLPIEYKNKYFKNEGNVWIIDEDVKRMVTFKKLNLQEDFSSMGRMDLILCRNVLIYFSEELKKLILKKFAIMLRPSGILLVGSSESISNYSSEFIMQNYEKSLYYIVK